MAQCMRWGGFMALQRLGKGTVQELGAGYLLQCRMWKVGLMAQCRRGVAVVHSFPPNLVVRKMHIQ